MSQCEGFGRLCLQPSVFWYPYPLCEICAICRAHNWGRLPLFSQTGETYATGRGSLASGSPKRDPLPRFVEVHQAEGKEVYLRYMRWLEAISFLNDPSARVIRQKNG